MNTVWEVVEESGVQVSISAAGRAKYEAERDAQNDRMRAEILMWTTAAAVVVIAVLVLKQLTGW